MQTAERSSGAELSDNFVFQRHKQAYELAIPFIKDTITLEVGTGMGYGTSLLVPHARHYTGVDKYPFPHKEIAQKYPFTFKQMTIPPLSGLSDNTFDTVVSFQVIEHIKDDNAFVAEIARVLKKGGKLILTTPNIKMSLTRNPWHIREYTALQLQNLLAKYFSQVEMKGIYGNEKVTAYYQKNKAAVAKITRFDILNLQYRLPRQLLQIPYDFFNRLNRRKLLAQNTDLVTQISTKDYYATEVADNCYDFFCVAVK